MKPRLRYSWPTAPRARSDKPDRFAQLVAGLAVIAWLVLAGDAFAQDNQWAPSEAGSSAPEGQSTGSAWGSGPAADQFAPADLDQRLSDGTANAPTAAQAAPALAAPVPATPTYAPPGTAASRLAPPPAGAGAVPQAQTYYGQTNGQPYAPAQPQPGYGGAGYGAYPTPGYAAPGYAAPGAGGYGQPYAPYNPYAPFGSTVLGYPGLPMGYGSGYPGPTGGGFVPGAGGWGVPNNGYGGFPIFGGSPFGFW